MKDYSKVKMNIAIIGLGYVGVPLAAEFSKKFFTIGFDINKKRINELKLGNDINLEVPSRNLKKIYFTSKKSDLAKANFYIVTVPTPVHQNNKPDLSLVFNACKLISKYLKSGDVVIFESTVYPGATEQQFVPILEK